MCARVLPVYFINIMSGYERFLFWKILGDSRSKWHPKVGVVARASNCLRV